MMLAQQQITTYGGAENLMIGKALRVWCGDFTSMCRLDCKTVRQIYSKIDRCIVDKCNISPLLGRKACLGMKIVAYLDNDELNKPSTGTSKVKALNSGSSPLTQEQPV